MSININYRTNSDKSHAYFSKENQNEKLAKFNKIITNPESGFFLLTDNNDFLTQTKSLVEKYSKKKHFVHIGIGGSSLGPQMLVSSLRTRWDISFTVLDNTDSDFLKDELDQIDPLETVFYVVSKSGGTAETIACYSIVRNLLKFNGVKESELGQYFVFCTDPSSGQLREHVTKHGYDSLEVPSNIGGRYSVLTPVGLFPALFMGINIDELYAGANDFKANLLNTDTDKNDLLQTSSQIAFHYFEKNINETVIMPYSSKMKDFSYWFVQLWAESLGKYSSAIKDEVGITPIPAYGATDQHSQMQLFMEGPKNKLMFLINITQKENDFALDSGLDLQSAQTLKPYKMNQLIEAEYQGTLSALKENSREVITIEIDRLNPKNIGALILFFESLTALMGEYLLVDPFNQPGVELGKKYTYEYLNSLLK